MTHAVLEQFGKLPSLSEEFIILVIGVTKMSAHSLTSAVGMGSRSHDLVVNDFRILRMSPSDTGSKEDRAVLLLCSLVRETGTNDFSAIYSQFCH